LAAGLLLRRKDKLDPGAIAKPPHTKIG